MKLLIVLFCLVATPVLAQQHTFRGALVDTYLAEEGFLDTLPAGTKLNCQDQLCSYSKAVRIYVFRNGGNIKRFWSTDYSDVMFDEPERVLTCENGGDVVQYDETNQLLYRDRACSGPEVEQPEESAPLLRFDQHAANQQR